MKPEIHAMFDKHYSSRAPLFGSTPTEIVVHLRNLLPSGARILDLGSGDGRDSLYLLAAGFHVTAMDLSESAISALNLLAKQKGIQANLSAIVADVRFWEPSPPEFDAVVGITILDHIVESFHQKILDSICLGVREGGYVALEMHSDRDPSIDPNGGEISEFAEAICAYAHANSLIIPFINGWRILEYSDRLEHDIDHGKPHDHGFCTILARKESAI